MTTLHGDAAVQAVNEALVRGREIEAAARSFLDVHGEIEEWENAYDEYVALMVALGPGKGTG